MRIYLAARYGRRAEISHYADTLTGLGHHVTARWLTGIHEAADNDTTRWAEFAQDDLDDIERAELVVSFTEAGEHPRDGFHVDFGYALARRKPLVIVGPTESVFRGLDGTLRFETWQEFLKVLCGQIGKSG